MHTLIAHFLDKRESRRAFVASLGALGMSFAGIGTKGDGLAAAGQGIDVWEIPNADAVPSTLAAAPEDPAFQRLLPQLQECVESETLQVMTRQSVTTS